MDSQTTVSELTEKVIQFRDARNWLQFHNLKDLTIGLSIEAAELQELFLWKNDDEVLAYLQSEEGRQRISEELADVMIYVLYIAHGARIDLSEAVENKIRLNGEKYPVEKCWGEKKKYTDL